MAAGVWGGCKNRRSSFGCRTLVGKNVEKGWLGSREHVHKQDRRRSRSLRVKCEEGGADGRAG